MPKIIKKYLLIGFLFGLCFPLGAWGFECILHGYSYTFDGIKSIHITTPVHFIIDSAPIVLGIAGYCIGKLHHKSVSHRNTLQQQLNVTENTVQELQLASTAIEDIVEQIKHGDFSNQLEFDTIGKLSLLIQAIYVELIESKKRDQEEKWLLDGFSKFSLLLNQENAASFSSLNNIVSELIKFTNTHIAGLYLVKAEEEKLQLMATYGIPIEEENQPLYPLHDGLLGQCYLNQTPELISNLPKGYLTIQSGLGHQECKEVLLIPLIDNQKVVAVLEIGSYDEISEAVQKFIVDVSDILAKAIKTELHFQETQELLNQTQDMSEMLQLQEEALMKAQLELQDKIRVQEENLKLVEQHLGKFEYTDGILHNLDALLTSYKNN